ncbi:ROK family protein [Hydrogenoanaerobacterium sp.]|uniref:ROK family protein n=1 Tax=Hydrogenoanaerobacterium sp. TaxID=2953763 RepID=UPI00289692BD|nr:ROK family protein [Hydrogenoanaerobacterium sp.]
MKIISLDIGGTSIKAGEVVDGKLVSRQEFDTNAKLGGAFVMQRAQEIVGSFSGFDRIGISTAGQVNPVTGTIRFANKNIPDYTGTQVKSLLEAAFGKPVVVENDVNAAAVGEAHFGAGRGVRDFLCITYGTGVGGAIVINGKVYSGSSFSAGEFGHIITHAGGELCNCGQQGCYERYASAGALVRLATKQDSTLTSGRAIFEQIHKPQVRELVDDWMTEILYGLTTLIHTFNPAMVVLGGGIMNEDYVTQGLQQRLPQHIMSSYHHVQLQQAQLRNNAGLMGAAYLAQQL